MKHVEHITCKVPGNGVGIHLELKKYSRGEPTVRLNHLSPWLMRVWSSLAVRDIEAHLAHTTDLNGATECISRESYHHDKCYKLT